MIVSVICISFMICTSIAFWGSEGFMVTATTVWHGFQPSAVPCHELGLETSTRRPALVAAAVLVPKPQTPHENVMFHSIITSRMASRAK